MLAITDVSKRFRLYARPWDRVLDWVGMGGRHQEFWALRHVDLNVPKGRTVGIVGPNGAGKSTLLKLITGTLVPTSGTIRTEGRVAALLELGTGFHPEFTGRQNIAINGQLLGLTPEEIAVHEAEIIAFSELGNFIDQPVRTYSSGMVVRLGFSIAASVNPQLLIVDEALSVGDARFSQKCVRRIREFRERGVTILFVSHDPQAVATLCDEAVLLDQGTIAHRGHPAEVLEHYNALLAARGEGNVEMRVRWVKPCDEAEASAPRRTGTFQALITEFSLEGAEESPREQFAPDDTMLIRARVLFLAPIRNPTVGFVIKDRLGVDVFGTNTALRGVALGDFEPGEAAEIAVRVELALGDGDYSVTAAVHSDETHIDACYDWSDRLALFRVRTPGRLDALGRVRLDARFEHARGRDGAPAIAGALDAAFDHVGDALVPGALVPSPFLAGFHAIEQAGEDAFRWTEGRAVFVLRPSTARLVMALTAPRETGETRVTLEAVGVGPCGSAAFHGSHGAALFDLPEACVGRRGLFQLIIDPTHGEPPISGSGQPPRTLGVGVFAIRSARPGEDHSSWQRIIRGTSSATSNA